MHRTSVGSGISTCPCEELESLAPDMRILLRFSPDFICGSESDRTCLTTLRQTVALDALKDFYLIYTPVISR